MMPSKSLFLLLLSWATLTVLTHGIVPPKTPVLTGFEPAAIGTNRELVCDADQPDAGTISYKWYKYAPKDTWGNTWESKGPIGLGQKYIFKPVSEKKTLYQGGNDEVVSGKYKCRASNSAGTRYSDWGDLYVYSKCSHYTVSVLPARPAVGSTFTLKCYIPNPSGMTVQWRKKIVASSPVTDVAIANSKGCQAAIYKRYSWSGCSPPSITLSSKPKTFNLQVTNAQTSDSAYWLCLDVGLSCTGVPVKSVVQALPGTPQITGFPSGPVAAGSQVNLKCVASPPGDDYDWYKDNTKLSTSLTYDFIAKKESAGVYKCVARNTAGSPSSSDKTLIVNWSATELKMVEKPNSPITAGKGFTIKCETDSSNSGSGTISWYRIGNGKEITTGVTPSTRSATDGGTIYISQLKVAAKKEDNQAKYECKINDQANFKKDVTITVHWSATELKMVDKPNSTITAGTPVNIKCDTDSSNSGSPVTISWYKNGQVITTGITPSTRSATDGGTIYISQLKVTARKEDNQAQYECKINDQANFKKDVTITVYYKSDSVVVLSVKTSCHAGKTDKFSCRATGGFPTPTLMVYIKRSGGGAPVEVTQGQDRVMVKEDNQAEYYCEAKVAGYPSFALTSTKKTYNVTFPNTKVSFINIPTAAVHVGHVKKFTCETDESNPVTSMEWNQYIGDSWQRGTSGIKSSESNSTFAYGGKIKVSEWSITATKAINARNIRCISRYSLTGHDFTTSADTVLNVKWSVTELKMVEKPNSSITAGASVNIKCETDSSNSESPGTILWYKNGQKITTGVTPNTRSATDGGTIYISQLTVTARKEDNQAKYECKINDQANFKKDVTVPVHFPPSGIQLSETSITVREGESKIITCSTTSSSNPVVSGVSVKKRLGSTEVVVAGTSRLVDGANYGKDVSIDIKLDTNRQDNGAQYSCSFTYGSISFTKTATVDVQFNPSTITIIQKPDPAIHEGQPITIVCETDSANPAADIQFRRKRTGGNWVKQTSGITSEDRNAPQYNGMIRKSTLTLTANRLDNQASFECKVEDGTFKVDQTATVTVYYPPTVKLSSSPKLVKEGDNLTLTCEASGGNPTSYTYSWYYNSLKLNETSKEYTITGIKYTQSGKYKCEAINYSPGGKAEDNTEIYVLYKAKWNPALPELFTVASKTNEPVGFVLHVIAKPPPTKVTWFFQNGTVIGKSFTALKVNDTTYTLNKTSVNMEDYGNYTVNVTNQVGPSTFVFELQRAGPPYPPCCLKMVNKTAVSVYLTFKSNFSGGSDQTFIIEQSPEGSRRKRSAWVDAAENIPDPGFEKDIFHKVKGLTNETTYQFRVKAVNADGSSGYNDPGNGNFLTVTTKAAPVADLVVTREDDTVTIRWGLERKYSKLQIEYCPVKGGGPCLYHDVESPAKQGSTTIDVNKEQTYKYSLVVFDGDDKVFASAHEQPPPPTTNPAVIGGGAGAGILLFLIIIAVIVAVVFIKKRRAEKGNGKLVTSSNTAEGTVNVAFNDPDDIDGGINPYADSGINPYADSDINPYADSIEMAASSSSTVQVEGAPDATYAVVNKGNKKPLLGGKGKKKDATPTDNQAYADVDFSKKLKKGKGKNKPTPETGEAGAAYAEVDFSKKKKGAAPSTPNGPDGAVYAQVNRKPPVGDEYAQVDFKKKASKKDAAPDTSGDVYAVVNKPTKPDKLPKPETSDDEAVYANVNGMAEGNVDGMAEDDIYEDVQDDALIKEGYKQPKTAYQVGVDGTIYSEVRIKPPKNPDVIIGKETIEDPYDSVDFTKEAPPLSNPDDPHDSGFIDLI